MPIGKEIYQNALTKKREPYIENMLALKKDFNCSGPWYYVELVSREVFFQQLYNIMRYCLFLALAALLLPGCNAYRVKPIARSSDNLYNKISFLLPPGRHVHIYKKNQLNHNSRYLTVEIMGLNGNYLDCIDQVKKAKMITHCKQPVFPAIGSSVPSTDYGAWVYVNGGSVYAVFDYTRLLKSNTTDAIKEFNDLGPFLLKTIASKLSVENVPVTQDIVKKIFELIPIPVESTLARYGYQNNGVNYMLMFDTDFHLWVDSVKKTSILPNSLDSEYVRQKCYTVKYKRNERGMPIQDKLADDNTNHQKPNDKLQDTPPVYLISSFADIQNSSELKDDPLIVIYSPIIKRNNDHSSTKPYHPLDDDKITTGNYCLFNMKAPDFVKFDFGVNTLTNNSTQTRSVFGPRNQGETCYYFFVNNFQREGYLGDYVKDVSFLPIRKKVYRLYKGKFKRVKGDVDQLMLLPGDQITYKL